MKERRSQRIAAINIGSNCLEMIIVEVFKNGEYFILEDIEKSINIGKSTFSKGKIDAECISETCNILNKFFELMKEYKVKIYKAVATTGVREAKNKDYVLEQIKVRCGIDIEILSNSMVRYYKHKALEEEITDMQEYYNEGTILLDIESGSVYSKMFKNGSIYRTSNAEIGPLRIMEKFTHLIEICNTYSDVIDNYMKNKLSLFDKKDNFRCETMILIGSQIDILKKFVKIKNDNIIKKNDFLEEYSKIKNLSINRICEKYEIGKSKAEMLVSICLILNEFLSITKCEKIKISFVALKNGLILDVIDEKLTTLRKNNFYDITISSANYVEKKYKGYNEENNYVEKYALELFDKTKNIHKLDSKDKIYLSIACKLMNIVPSLGLIDNEIFSYNIIINEEIEGMSNEDMKIIANIVRYQDKLDPYEDLIITNLKRIFRLKVAKLSSILRIARSLGITRKNKYSKILMSISANELIIRVRSKEDCILEEWSMSKNKILFEEVMGYKVTFKNIIERGE